MRLTPLLVLSSFLLVSCGSSGSGGSELSVSASLSPEQVSVGQTAQVSCQVFDAEGVLMETPTDVTAGDDVTVENDTVRATSPGSYEISCHATEYPAVAPGTATLEVIEAQIELASVKLSVLPEKEVYEIGDTVTFSWVGTDADGNEIADLSGNLSIPGGAMTIEDQSAHKYSFVAEGIWTVELNLDAPHDGLKDEVTLIVDNTPPVVTVTYPERGATIQGNGEPFKVTGTVTESVGTIASVTINGEEVSLTEDGSFSTLMKPEWGLNLILVEATDSNGLKGKLSPSFQYSADFASFIETDAKGLTIDDGLQIRLGQSFLDDGDHDPTKIDDMATLLEVVLTNLDIESLINDSLSGTSGSQPLANIAGFSATLEYVVQVIVPTDVGPTYVTLQCKEGGIAVTIVIGDETAPGLDLTLQVPATIDVEAPFVGSIGSTTMTLNTGLTLSKLVFTGFIALDMPQGGDLTADFQDMELDFTGVQLDPIEDITVEMSLTPPFVSPITWTGSLSDLIDLNALTDTILDPVVALLMDGLSMAIEPLLETFAGTVLSVVVDVVEINETIDVPNLLDPNAPSVELDIYTNLSRLHFTELGAEIGLSFGTYIEKNVTREPLGSIRRAGCLQDAPDEFTYDWAHELGVALKIDSLNALLFSFWRSGSLNGPVDLSDLGGSSPIPVAGLEIATEFYLAPILYECGGTENTIIQIGDLRLVLDGKLLGLDIDAVTFLDISLNAIFETKPDGFYVTIGEINDFDMEVDQITQGAGTDAVKELLQDHLAGLIGNLLVGESFGPIELPSVDLSETTPGIPPGSVLEFQNLTLSQSSGYVLIEGDLE